MVQVIILAAIAVFGFSAFILIYKRFRFNKLILLLQQQQFKQFDELINKKSSTFLFPYFNSEYLKLNSYLIRGDQKQIEKSFDNLFKTNLSKKQKEDIYMKAFNYYVGMENKQKVKQIVAVIDTLNNETMQKEVHTIYDIFILKKANYIEVMEASFDELDDNSKGITAYLLSVQYSNIKDTKKEKEYRELSKKFLSASEEEIMNRVDPKHTKRDE